jgi:PAS domain S-box-containing protein
MSKAKRFPAPFQALPSKPEPGRGRTLPDLPERPGSQAFMRASEIRYRRLFEAARDGILIVEPTTRKITDANPFMTELLGYPHKELVGKELWEIGLLEDEKSSQAAFRELQNKHFIRYEDLPLQNKAGQRHEVEFVSNLYEEDGREVIQCNIRDITERKRSERELRAAKDIISRHASQLEGLVDKRTAELRESVRDLEAFSYTVSHDMRAPLRAMQGYAELVTQEYADKSLDATAADYLQRISRAALRLDHLIQDVLSYTKVLRVEAPLVPVDLDRLTRDIIENRPSLRQPGAEVLIQGSLPLVLGNEALLTQCISNLLSNALKFVPPGTSPRVRIRAETVDAGLRVWFEDNGIGIASENHGRVFRMFERIHPASQYEGTGIGLTIVRKAAERMRAKVGFESELGKGSRFWILLAQT